MSTATTSLRLIKQAQSDTGWGLLLNSGVMDVVDLAIAGTANIVTTGGTTTLDNADYVADNGKAAILNVSGVLGSNATIVIPNASKTYIVVNGTSGAFSLTIKTSAGSGITIPQGYTQKVRCDGSNGTTYATVAVLGSSGALPGVVISPPAASLNRGIDITQSGPTSGSAADHVYFNSILVDGDALNVADGAANGYALNVRYNFGGANLYGQRAAGRFHAFLQEASSPANPISGVYVALSGEMHMQSPDNGTDTGAGAKGSGLGLYGSVIAADGAVNLHKISGGEINTAVKLGASARIHIGWQISAWSTHEVPGAELDAALYIGNQDGAPGWYHYGIVFDQDLSGSGIALDAAATLMGTRGALAFTNGVDMRSATISGLAFASEGFEVDGAGFLEAVRGTFGGDPTSNFLDITGPEGTPRALRIQTGGVDRWRIQGSATTETGSGNTGTNLVINRFDDAGVSLGTVMTVVRSTGVTTFAADVIVPDEAYDASAWNASLEVPTKNAVRDYLETLTGTTLPAAYQPLDTELSAIAGLTSAADRLAYFTGSGTAALATFSSVARTLVAQTTQALMRTTGLGLSANGSSLVVAADYAAMRVLLDLEAGTDFYSISAANAAFQAADAELGAIAGLTSAADRVPYFTGSGTAALATFTSVARTLVAQTTQSLMLTTGLGLSANGQSLVTAASYAAMRTLLDLEAGTDFYSISAANAAFQPIDSDLTSWAGVTRASGFDTFAATPSSANLRALVTDESGSGALLFASGALGTPASGTLTNCTGLPVSGITASAVTALGVGSLELGNASDTTLSRSSAGVLAVEGVVIPSISSTNTLSNKTLSAPFVTGGLVSGHTAALSADGSNSPALQQHGADSPTSSGMFARWQANAGGSNLYLNKSRGAIGTHTIVSASDIIGQIWFNGSDGTNFIPAARIRAIVNGTPGTNDMPGALILSATADGAASATDILTLSSAGINVVGDTQTDTLRIDQTPTAVSGAGPILIGSGSTINTRIQVNMNGTTYWIPASTTAF